MDRQTANVFDVSAVADWRRRVAEMYAGVRSVPNHGMQAWQGWRAIRDDLMKTHAASPLSGDQQATFSELDYFDYDPAMRFLVGTTKPDDRSPVVISLADDDQLVIEPALVTNGLKSTLGEELIIYWVVGYGGGLFLPFGDPTNQIETYSGGRYLIDSIKGVDHGNTEDDRLILDFNFAYNPSCAYSPRWTCPLASETNRLPMAVLAGEKHTRENV